MLAAISINTSAWSESTRGNLPLPAEVLLLRDTASLRYKARGENLPGPSAVTGHGQGTDWGAFSIFHRQQTPSLSILQPLPHSGRRGTTSAASRGMPQPGAGFYFRSCSSQSPEASSGRSVLRQRTRQPSGCRLEHLILFHFISHTKSVPNISHSHTPPAPSQHLLRTLRPFPQAPHPRGSLLGLPQHSRGSL